MNQRPVLLAAASLVAALSQAGAAAAQSRDFCSGLLATVNNVIACPEGMDEIGGAALGVICVGQAGPRPDSPPRPTPEQLEAQVQGCLPAGWSVGAFQSGVVGHRPARFRDYVRQSDRMRVRVGELTILRPVSRSARADIVELRQAFIAVPPGQ